MKPFHFLPAKSFFLLSVEQVATAQGFLWRANTYHSLHTTQLSSKKNNKNPTNSPFFLCWQDSYANHKAIARCTQQLLSLNYLGLPQAYWLIHEQILQWTIDTKFSILCHLQFMKKCLEEVNVTATLVLQVKSQKALVKANWRVLPTVKTWFAPSVHCRKAKGWEDKK